MLKGMRAPLCIPLRLKKILYHQTKRARRLHSPIHPSPLPLHHTPDPLDSAPSSSILETDEIDFAMKFGKLWSLHLNDQNGLKYDQDRPFGNVSLRSAFDQIRALERNGYGKNGEYVCFDVHPFRTTKPEHWMDHLLNSRRTFELLVQKVRSFDEKAAAKLVADRNYQALDQMVIEHLLGK